MTASLWTNREFIAFAIGQSVDRFSASAMTVLLGFQVYTLRGEPLDLALLGAVEVVPALTLLLFAGDIADRVSRRGILKVTTLLLAALAALLAAASAGDKGLMAVLLASALLSASFRAFQHPAAVGLEAQVLPADQVFRGVPALALSVRVADMMGPVVMGFVWAAAGPVVTYGILAALFATSFCAFVFGIGEKPVYARGDGSSPFARIREGITYVFRNQVLVGSMALDLFAVFFGGAAALLPVFATDILQVGPAGLGFLRAATAAGALAAALFATRAMPKERAGLALHGVVAGFGVSMIVFGLSTSFVLSLAALFAAGVCDGMSMVIRQAILRLASPEHLRSRIAAVRMVFVGSSNELGAVESGLAASLLGPARAVWAGGVLTILVVGAVAWRMPLLVNLNLIGYGPGAHPVAPEPKPAA
ncbi:MFS transporter [Prosthecomicrobium sp. N25]|uniref:MFS transporter n=1 Tax=Prosthecomicrobium sp. N25 TaxID=3129254 RepID=UPI003077A079